MDDDVWIGLFELQPDLGGGRHQFPDDDPLGAPTLGAENVFAEAFNNAVDAVRTRYVFGIDLTQDFPMPRH